MPRPVAHATMVAKASNDAILFIHKENLDSKEGSAVVSGSLIIKSVQRNTITKRSFLKQTDPTKQPNPLRDLSPPQQKRQPECEWEQKEH